MLRSSLVVPHLTPGHIPQLGPDGILAAVRLYQCCLQVIQIEVVVADRALRGMQIGSKSLESEDGVIFADRYEARYVCPQGHDFRVTLSTDAEPPATWECRCGENAELVGETEAEEEVKPVKPQRTHWDMLLERRSLEELDQLLNEQLELYRSGHLRLDTGYRRG